MGEGTVIAVGMKVRRWERDGHSSWNDSKEMRETMVIGAGKTTRRWEKGCHSSWNESKMADGMVIAARMKVRWEMGWS